MKKCVLIISLFCFIMILTGCESSFMDAKPKKSLLVPSGLSDMEALLNNSREIMNISGYLSLVADGDFRIDENYLPFMDNPTQINYVWSDAETSWVGDWDYGYRQIFYANVVLQGLSRLKEENIELQKELKGRALFYRAWALHLIAQQFSPVYQKELSGHLPGIPCPLSPDVNNTTMRGSQSETYDQIFTDLYSALELLPDKALFITQPSKTSTYALLARLHLITGEYEKALDAADNTLKRNNTLLDFKILNPSLPNPFPSISLNMNTEILYYAVGNTTFSGSSFTFVDSTLYEMYENHDMRKALFFSSDMNYKGSYSGNPMPFTGLATDEIYLIKAECQARKSDLTGGLATLNLFRSARYAQETFSDLKVMSSNDLIEIILQERRKELIGRGTTWMDLRRLNKETNHSRILKRRIGSNTFTLTPNNSRYVMKIPMDEILGSGIDQNP